MMMVRRSKATDRTERISINFNGKRYRFPSGTNSKTKADRIRMTIVRLLERYKTGEPDLELVDLVEKTLSEPLKEKLREIGLLNTKATHTLGELVDYFLSRTHSSKNKPLALGTLGLRDRACNWLLRFFKRDEPLQAINPERMLQFSEWLHTVPVANYTKLSTKATFAESTTSGYLRTIKNLFNHAIALEWIIRNPLDRVAAPMDANYSRWHYVPKEDALAYIACVTVITEYKALFALARFAGLRGRSEYKNLRWEHYREHTADSPATLFVPAEKNKRHQRIGRTIPLTKEGEYYMTLLKQERKASANELIFKAVPSHSNVLERLAVARSRAGLEVIPEPWYNCRRSFCSDLLATGVDITVYEEITDHSITVSKKHYQILNEERIRKGYATIFGTEKKRDILGTQISPDGPKTGPYLEIPTDTEPNKESFEDRLSRNLRDYIQKGGLRIQLGGERGFTLVELLEYLENRH